MMKLIYYKNNIKENQKHKILYQINIKRKLKI